jgi:hypothetical protein
MQRFRATYVGRPAMVAPVAAPLDAIAPAEQTSVDDKATAASEKSLSEGTAQNLRVISTR